MKRLTLEQIVALAALFAIAAGLVGTWYKLADIPAAVEKMDQRLDDHDVEFSGLVQTLIRLENDNDRRLDREAYR